MPCSVGFKISCATGPCFPIGPDDLQNACQLKGKITNTTPTSFHKTPAARPSTFYHFPIKVHL